MKVKSNVELKNKTKVMPVLIRTSFDTLEQRLLFEAVVLPDLVEVLNVYAPMLGIAGINEREVEENA